MAKSTPTSTMTKLHRRSSLLMALGLVAALLLAAAMYMLGGGYLLGLRDLLNWWFLAVTALICLALAGYGFFSAGRTNAAYQTERQRIDAQLTLQPTVVAAAAPAAAAKDAGAHSAS